MSTKSVSAATGTQNLAATPAHTPGLCAPQLLPPSANELMKKDLSAGAGSLSFRIFNPAADTMTVYKWISLEFEGPLKTKPAPPPALQESYTVMLESDMAQPFIGVVNGIPVCQINICHVRQDILSLSYAHKPGDYALQLALAPLSVQDNIVAMLQTFLGYCFGFPEVTRIIADVDDRNEWLHNLFTRTGFQARKKLHTSYRNSHLLFCTRSAAQRALRQKLLTGGY